MKKFSLTLLFIVIFAGNVYASEDFFSFYPQEAQNIVHLLDEKKQLDETTGSDTMNEINAINIQETKKIIKTGKNFTKDIKAEKGLQAILKKSMENIYYVPFLNYAKEEWLMKIEINTSTGELEYNRHNIKKSLLTYAELADKISGKHFEFLIVPFPNLAHPLAIAYVEEKQGDFIIFIEKNLEKPLKTGEIYTIDEFAKLSDAEKAIVDKNAPSLVRPFLCALSAVIIVTLLCNVLPKYISKRKKETKKDDLS